MAAASLSVVACSLVKLSSGETGGSEGEVVGGADGMAYFRDWN